MGSRMKNLNIFGVHCKTGIFRGEVHEKTNIEGGMSKKGAWTFCRFKGRGAWQERGGWCF